MNMESASTHRSGFTAVAGRPNVGKSTLVNRMVGAELSIVTPKEQTTRNRINAIYSSENAQIVLQDTPGIHDPKTTLNKSLVNAALKALEDADAILLIVTPSAAIHADDERTLAHLASVRKPVILAVNKVDSFGRDRAVAASEMFREKMAFRGVFLISALTGEGVPELLEALIGLLPFGPPLFPTDEMSDLPTRFFVSEIIREQVILLTGEEIPYKTAVEIMSFQEEAKIIRIHADIHTERDSQKKILIGKGGKMIKAIGVAARKKIEEFLGAKTHLELFVKVTPGWTKSDRILREFGY